ncbi:hypothetical protein JW968_04115 [Candidatus Woesearchaeota archaeon]|nr:hypothetical protein [Candidatus Woesearchaeota archaeon]
MLPPKSDLDVLIRNETISSRTFSINIDNYPPSEVSAVFDAIYAAITRPRDISRFPDVSSIGLENAAVYPLQALYTKLAREYQMQMQILRNYNGSTSVN